MTPYTREQLLTDLDGKISEARAEVSALQASLARASAVLEALERVRTDWTHRDTEEDGDAAPRA